MNELYQGRAKFIERLPTREWARVGAFSLDQDLGKIPGFHRLSPAPEGLLQMDAFNGRVFDAGLETQNYDKGLDRFIRKFKPDQEMTAVCAIIGGFHADHGTAVYCTQGKRRCLPLDTPYGLSDDEALWHTLASSSCNHAKSTPIPDHEPYLPRC
jgi:hypothetical protein